MWSCLNAFRPLHKKKKKRERRKETYKIQGGYEISAKGALNVWGGRN